MASETGSGDPGYSGRELIRRAKDGDPEALASLFVPVDKVFCGRFRKLISGRLRPRLGDSDVVQYALASAVQKFGEFEGETFPEFLSWVWSIFERQLSDFLRFHRREKRDIRRHVASELAWPGGDLPDSSPTPLDKLLIGEEKQELYTAINRLPEDYRRAVVLRGIRELSFAEVGRRLSRTPDAARMLYSRAMEMLRSDYLHRRHQS